MGRSDLSLQAQVRKSLETSFFVTSYIFPNGTHFVALTRLRATKTMSNIFSNNYQKQVLDPECVRIQWVLAPKKFTFENFRVGSDLRKSSIFH